MRLLTATQAALVGVVAAIVLGTWEVPLPFPATTHTVGQLPLDKVPGVAMNLTGPLKPNTLLKDSAVKLFTDKILGSESVAPGPDDTSITMLDRYGYVWVADTSPSSGTYELRPDPLAYLGPGRPLGFTYDAHGNLIACDSLKGLIALEGAADAAAAQRSRLRAGGSAEAASATVAALGGVSRRVASAAADVATRAVHAAGVEPESVGLHGAQTGEGQGTGEGGAMAAAARAASEAAHAISPATSRPRLLVLANRVSRSSPFEPDTAITYANDLDIAPSTGHIYFSDCQNITTALNRHGFYDTFSSWALGFFSGLPTGRLLRYNPDDGTTVALASGFWFANGVAVSADEQFVAVAETNNFRVARVWIAGPKAGTTDTLINDLPGFPDGMSRSEDGNFWIAIVAPRMPLVPYIRHALVRAIGAWLPEAIRPKPTPQGLVIKVSPSGQVLRSLWDPTGETIAGISGVEERRGRLWLGQLSGKGVGYYDLDQA